MPSSPGYGLYIKVKTVEAFNFPSIEHTVVSAAIQTMSDPIRILIKIAFVTLPVFISAWSTPPQEPGVSNQFHLHLDLREDHQSALPSTLSPVIYRSSGSKHNRYKPVFETREAMLSGRVINDITTRKERDEPKPMRAKKPVVPSPPDAEKERVTKERKDKEVKKKKEKRETKETEKKKQRKEKEKKGKIKNQTPKNLSESTAADRELHGKHPLRSIPVGFARACLSHQLLDAYGRVFIKNLLDLCCHLQGSSLTQKRAKELDHPQGADNDTQLIHHFSDVQRLIYAATLARFSKQCQRHLSKFQYQTFRPDRTSSTSVNNLWPLTYCHKTFGFRLGIINPGSYANAINCSISRDRCGQATSLFSTPFTNKNSPTTSPPLPTMVSSIAFVSHTSVTKTASLGEQQRVALTAAIHDPSFISNVTTGIYQAARNDSQSMAQALHSATDLCNTQVYAYMATVLFIRALPLASLSANSSLYRLKPTYNGSLTTLQTIWPNNPDVRRHLLDLIVQDSSFMDSLGNILYAGERRRQSKNKDLIKSMGVSHIELFFQRKSQPDLFDLPTHTLSEFLKSALTPGYVYFTEPVFRDYFYANEFTKRIVNSIVDLKCYPGALSENYAGYDNSLLNTQRGLFIKVLFGHRGHSDRNISIVSDNRATHYKFKGTLQTNGLVVNRLALDTTENRYPMQQLQHQQQTFSGSCGSSSNNGNNGDDLDNDVLDSVDDDLRQLDDDTENEEADRQSPDSIKSGSSAVLKEWTHWTAGTTFLPIEKMGPKMDGKDEPVRDSKEDSARDNKGEAMRRVARGSSNGTDLQLERVVVCIGLVNFNSRTSLPFKHTKLMRHFVKRARPLGVAIVGRNEYFTSTKCPQQDCGEFLQSLHNRSKYYGRCRVHFARDAVSTENIASCS
ncbi:hypothetical protein BGZ47_007227 [Haplosporangium gracile]|nr:hypothetical protein BGZ47_007227 [Haplosporangium gracile]